MVPKAAVGELLLALVVSCAWPAARTRPKASSSCARAWRGHVVVLGVQPSRCGFGEYDGGRLTAVPATWDFKNFQGGAGAFAMAGSGHCGGPRPAVAALVSNALDRIDVRSKRTRAITRQALTPAGCT